MGKFLESMKSSIKQDKGNKIDVQSKRGVVSVDIKPSVEKLFKDREEVPPSIYDRMKGLDLIDENGNSYEIK